MNGISSSHLAGLSEPVRAALVRMREDSVVERMWNKDHTLWSPDPAGIGNRMGWMDSPEAMVPKICEIDPVVEAVRAAGYTHALLLGMGGSSLAPEVMRRIFGFARGHLDLAVLDSTDPAAVLAQARRLDPSRTLFIAATKSGGTVETISFLNYFYNLLCNAPGPGRPGDHFIAITDPGSGLEELARGLGFRHLFLNDPDIGGRYSALSFFGLVPARLAGIDIERLLDRAREAVDQCRSTEDNPGIFLGAAIACGALAGRDKLTLAASPAMAPLGTWIEQLLAESTGKEGKGILPVDGEALSGPEQYAGDRLFVRLRLAGDSALDGRLEALETSGNPVITLDIDDAFGIAGQFVIWEIATVVAGHLLGINPYDQPDVEAAKKLAGEMTETYRRDRTLPPEESAMVDGDLRIYGAAAGASRFPAALSALFAAASTAAKRRSYVCLQAWLPPEAATDAALERLRLAIRDRTGMAVTAGYGPRFLHSTGQLHKGDAGHGLFLQLTCDDAEDAAIPDRPGSPESAMSFGVLKAAQARGDRQALNDAGRRVLRLHLGADVPGALDRIALTATRQG